MRHLAAFLAVALIGTGLVAGGCAQATPAPVPTAAPAAPTKAPEPAKAAEPTKAPAVAPAPTQAPAAQPTAAPAKKVDWPEKGKPIAMLVGYAAGGSMDLSARILAAPLEKELGAPVQVVNRAGAGEQIALTELVRAKPDGYTIMMGTLGTWALVYSDPERKAAFTRQDLLPVAFHNVDSVLVAVRADSPFKTAKDLVDAAKAQPEKIKGGTSGILTNSHLSLMVLEKAAGVKFAAVNFDGDATAKTAMLGGNIDIYMGQIGGWLPQVKSGQLRALGVMDKEESKFLPGVKTFEAQGYKAYGIGSTRAVIAPAGTPKEVVDILSQAIKRAMDTDDHKKRLEDMGTLQRYMGPAELQSYWTEVEGQVKPLLEDWKKTQK